MSAGNLFLTRKKAFDLYERTVTASTATTKVGGSSDGFVEDRVVNVVTTSAVNCTVTVTNGTYEGQRVLINFLTEGSNETVTVTTTTGSDYSLTAAGDFCSLEWVNSTVGWTALASQET